MNIFANRGLLFGLRIYLIAALIASAVMSPPALSIAVAIPLLLYVFLWWLRRYHYTFLMTEYCIFYIIAILFSQKMNPLISPLFSLPILILFTQDLAESASKLTIKATEHKWSSTPLGYALFTITILSLTSGIVLANISLLICGCIGIIFLATLALIARYKMPPQPITTEPLTLRIVAGTKSSYLVTLKPRTNIGAGFLLTSPYDWLKIIEPQFNINGKDLISEITLTPPLSGPLTIQLAGTIIDRWGLTQTSFEIEPFHLAIVPRARYAEWLAKKYLMESKSGTLPLISSLGITRQLYGLRRGVEYYGSQLYQPGDSLKNMDWKRSIKYNKLITKEFADVHEQEAIMLVNLVVANAEEADKQAYNIVTTALSLAREQIPTAIAAYDDKKTIVLTDTLQPNQLVTQALETYVKIIMINNPKKYLGSPDIIRLRSNIQRLQHNENSSSQKLVELLLMEYTNLKNISNSNPATKTLNAAMSNLARQTSIIILTQYNHDSEAIEFNRNLAFSKGRTVIAI